MITRTIQLFKIKMLVLLFTLLVLNTNCIESGVMLYPNLARPLRHSQSLTKTLGNQQDVVETGKKQMDI